ncbi:hypothetical protein [Saccharopolyspora flava]|uniref:hypothetical protein n=1 Tax=Saccharopolyspora flava TaxID=95161 RepID=UPI000A8751FB|nr:hypothetical protein [Saccharopolyspora flava]
MSPKRKERAAPPADHARGHWEIRFGNTASASGWEELCRQAAGNLSRAWELLRTDPVRTAQTGRHHRLKGSLSSAPFEGRQLPQWQIEVTGAARIWYLIDEERKTVWIQHAGTGHPKATER